MENRKYRFDGAMLLLFFMLFCMNACEDKNQEQKDIIMRQNYPEKIDSLGLRQLVDDAKWLLYCLQYDSPLRIVTKKDYPNFPQFKDYTLGMVDFQFCEFINYKKSFRVAFLSSAYYDTILTFQTADGIKFHRFTGNPLLIGGGTWWTNVSSKQDIRMNPLTKNDTNYFFRLYKPITKELKNYITSNFNDLDVWFRHEAIRRGVISPFYAFESYPPLSKLERAFGISDAYKSCIVDSPQVRFEEEGFWDGG